MSRPQPGFFCADILFDDLCGTLAAVNTNAFEGPIK
jgi:hypothetical protein